MVSKEKRETQVIQKVHGQDHQEQRETQDCQVMWEVKEKEGHLVHLAIWGLPDLRGSLEILEVLAIQESRVLVVIWALKESEASLALQEEKGLQDLQDSQGLRDQWV